MRICGWVNWGGGGSGRSWVNFCTKGRMEEEEQGRSGREVCGPRWNVCAAIKISIKIGNTQNSSLFNRFWETTGAGLVIEKKIVSRYDTESILPSYFLIFAYQFLLVKRF